MIQGFTHPYIEAVLIVYAKFNLEITYTPPSLPEVWHYKDANIELIQRAINEFNWTRAFSNTNVNEKVNIFNNTILNILSNFYPRETLTSNAKDLSWFNKEMKEIIQDKNNAFKAYCNDSSNTALKNLLRHLQVRFNPICLGKAHCAPSFTPNWFFDRCILTISALKLISYDFFSNFKLNMGQ